MIPILSITYLLFITSSIDNLSLHNNNQPNKPITILFSASPDQIINDAIEWRKHGVEAFFLDFIAREWSDNIWTIDKKPWTIGEEDDFFQKTKKANQICKSLGMQTFLKIAFDHPFDWFNDIQWENVIHNFRQFGHFAKHTECNGIALDIEYIGAQYNFEWEGYNYNIYSRKELIQKVKERSRALIRALLCTFPEMIFLTFPEQGPHLGLIIHLTWLEELAKSNARGGFHYCLEHTYRLKSPEEYFGYIAGIDQLFITYLSNKGKKYWRKHCSIAPGIWPIESDYNSAHIPGFSLEEFKKIYSLHTTTARRFNWIYSHNSYDQLLGRNKEQFRSEFPLQEYLHVLQDSKICFSPEWIQNLEALKNKNYHRVYNNTGYIFVLLPVGPDDHPRFQTLPSITYPTSFVDKLWNIGKRYMEGEEINFQSIYQPITQWHISKPYKAHNFKETHETSFEPEIDLSSIPWQVVSINPNRTSIELTENIGKYEGTCIYAYCSIQVTEPIHTQLRIGYNDAIKVWLVHQNQYTLLFDYFGESSVIPDKMIIPLYLETGIYTLLLKVTNNKYFWGFTARITDMQGKSEQDKILFIN